jgi:hypothetical protein
VVLELAAGKGKLETRRQKLEKEGIAAREPSQINGNKEACERQPSDRSGRGTQSHPPHRPSLAEMF